MSIFGVRKPRIETVGDFLIFYQVTFGKGKIQAFVFLHCNPQYLINVCRLIILLLINVYSSS